MYMEHAEYMWIRIYRQFPIKTNMSMPKIMVVGQTVIAAGWEDRLTKMELYILSRPTLSADLVVVWGLVYLVSC